MEGARVATVQECRRFKEFKKRQLGTTINISRA
jgi:hypothetical protein